MTHQPLTPPNLGDPNAQPVRVVNQIGVLTITLGVALGSILGVVLGAILLGAIGVGLS